MQNTLSCEKDNIQIFGDQLLIILYMALPYVRFQISAQSDNIECNKYKSMQYSQEFKVVASSKLTFYRQFRINT